MEPQRFSFNANAVQFSSGVGILPVLRKTERARLKRVNQVFGTAVPACELRCHHPGPLAHLPSCVPNAFRGRSVAFLAAVHAYCRDTQPLLRVAVTCSVSGAVNHGFKRRKDRYTYASNALDCCGGTERLSRQSTFGHIGLALAAYSLRPTNAEITSTQCTWRSQDCGSLLSDRVRERVDSQAFSGYRVSDQGVSVLSNGSELLRRPRRSRPEGSDEIQNHAKVTSACPLFRATSLCCMPLVPCSRVPSEPGGFSHAPLSSACLYRRSRHRRFLPVGSRGRRDNYPARSNVERLAT